MGTKISQLIPQARTVSTGAGEFTVHALTLSQLLQVLYEHRDAVLSLFLSTKDGKGPDYGSLLINAPEVVEKIIMMGADIDPADAEEILALRSLSGVVQLTALAEIWEATIPDPKKLLELLNRLLKIQPVQNGPKPIGNVDIATLPEASAA